MKTGLSSYTYTWAVGVPGNLPAAPLDVFNLVDVTRLSGMSLLQIADNLPLHKLGHETLEMLREHAQKNGVELEVGARGLTSESLLRYIKITSVLKSSMLRFVVDESGYEPDVKTIVALIHNVIPLLEKDNITLALENHDRLHSAVFREIVETINHPNVGICLDSVNSMGIAEGLETVVENLAPYTVNFHVKDFCIKRLDHKMGFVVEGTPAGRGMLNIPWILEHLNKWSRCRSMILELWTPPASNVEETIAREKEWAAESIAYLKNGWVG